MHNRLWHFHTKGILCATLLYCTSCTTAPSDNVPQHTPNIESSQSLDSHRHTLSRFDALRTRGIGTHSDIDLNTLEPGEVCIINSNKSQVTELDHFAETRHYIQKKRRTLTDLGFIMSILEVPPGTTVQEGIADLRQAFPTQIIDANHHYHLQGLPNATDPRRYGHHLVGWTKQSMSCTSPNLSVGMIDTTIDHDRVTKPHRTIQAESFLSATSQKAKHHHGTAVATLLVGHSESVSSGLLPLAALHVAEAFRETAEGKTEATTWSIVRSLDWLVGQQVDVINLSFGGPSNALLTYAVQRTLQQDVPIIAAAGHAGPQGLPTYPAALPGVIAVTAIDVNLKPFQHASQGSYVAFSAPGVDIWIPNGKTHGVYKSGTSFATPFVTAAAAAMKHSQPTSTPEHIAHQLARQALDLGAIGKDDTFGWGLIQMPNTCPKTSSSIHTQSSITSPDSIASAIQPPSTP